MVRTRWHKISPKPNKPRYICGKHNILHAGKCPYCLFDMDGGVQYGIGSNGTALFPTNEDRQRALAVLATHGLKMMFETGEITEVRYPQKHERRPENILRRYDNEGGF